MKLVIGDYQLSSWSLRPWLALTHAALPFTTEVIRLDRPETASTLAAASPSRRVPVLHDGNLVIWESLAICEYIAERAPSLWPADRAMRAVARAVSCEMHAGFSSLRSQHPMQFTSSLPKPPSLEVRRDLDRIDALWGGLLDTHGGPWLFGTFSIADAMFAPVCSRVRTYDLPVSDTSARYVATMFAHHGMIEWETRARAEVAGK